MTEKGKAYLLVLNLLEESLQICDYYRVIDACPQLNINKGFCLEFISKQFSERLVTKNTSDDSLLEVQF